MTAIVALLELGVFVKIGVTAGGIACALACSPVAASASVYSDDLARCLVNATTETDKTMLVKWIFAALSTSPKVTSLTAITAEDRQAFHKQAAKLMERLIYTDCRKQTVEAIKYDGLGAIQSSFQLLGQVATSDLMADPIVSKEMEAFGAYFDEEKWIALGLETGRAAPQK